MRSLITLSDFLSQSSVLHFILFITFSAFDTIHKCYSLFISRMSSIHFSPNKFLASIHVLYVFHSSFFFMYQLIVIAFIHKLQNIGIYKSIGPLYFLYLPSNPHFKCLQSCTIRFSYIPRCHYNSHQGIYPSFFCSCCSLPISAVRILLKLALAISVRAQMSFSE